MNFIVLCSKYLKHLKKIDSKYSIMPGTVTTSTTMSKNSVLIEELPTLYGSDKSGKTKVWIAKVYCNTSNGVSYSEVQHGLLNGKLQTAVREIATGKNIGKKNETTALQQCLQETRKKWQDKKEKERYSENIGIDGDCEDSGIIAKEKQTKFFPMLAHKYEPTTTKAKRNDIVFPCYVQPKLDGLRCATYVDASTGNIVNQSRVGKYFRYLDHINTELSAFFGQHPHMVLDGELYTTEMPFEELAGIIKKEKLKDGDQQRLAKVQYHIYDLYDNSKPDMAYCQRYAVLLKDLAKLAKTSTNIRLVRTELVECKDEFKEMFCEFVGGGYEGIMLRNTGGLYRQNYRSHDLQKYKEFMEDEYPIIGFKEGEGRDKGLVIWICRTPGGQDFAVRPKGTLELRRELYKNGEQYIGKQLTVIYQELSEMGVPRFPVGKDIRDGY